MCCGFLCLHQDTLPVDSWRPEIFRRVGQAFCEFSIHPSDDHGISICGYSVRPHVSFSDLSGRGQRVDDFRRKRDAFFLLPLLASRSSGLRMVFLAGDEFEDYLVFVVCPGYEHFCNVERKYMDVSGGICGGRPCLLSDFSIFACANGDPVFGSGGHVPGGSCNYEQLGGHVYRRDFGSSFTEVWTGTWQWDHGVIFSCGVAAFCVELQGPSQ